MATLENTQNIHDHCISCGACVRACSFLTTHAGMPKHVSISILKGTPALDPKIPYLCNLCGLCHQICRFDLNPGAMMQEARFQIFQEGGQLPGYLHLVPEAHAESARGDDLMFSPAPSGTTKRLFFPGCNLVRQHAASTIACACALQRRDPDCGILLGCCGAPMADLGDELIYKRMLRRVREAMDACGATELLLACTNCARHFTDDSDIATRDVYGILAADWGSYEGEETTSACQIDDLVIHDPCKSRFFPDTQHAARDLLQKRGYVPSEPKNTGDRTLCCGQGGMVAYTDYQWADTLGKARAEEIGGTLVSYCATCRNTLCYWGLQGAHVLDLMFLDGDACQQALVAAAASDEERAANRQKVREALIPASEA